MERERERKEERGTRKEKAKKEKKLEQEGKTTLETRNKREATWYGRGKKREMWEQKPFDLSR